MMKILCGPSRVHVELDRGQRCVPEQLFERVYSRRGPYWLSVEDQLIRLECEDTLMLACDIVSCLHNALCYDGHSNDALRDEVAEIEREVQERLESPSDDDTEDEAGSVTPSQDMVYENLVYI